MSDFDGVWETTVNTPMGPQKGTLTLTSEGGALSGTMAGPQGTIDIENGKVEGKASWTINISNPMPMTLEFSATVVEGDEISGNVKLGGFGNASFTGTRKS